MHPPKYPRSDWKNDFGFPWWKDSNYCIGLLTKRTRKIKVINTLSNQEHLLEVCSEETINEIVERYCLINSHGKEYEWKRLGNSLDMNLTLEQNNIPDEQHLFNQLQIENDYYYPALHIYYSQKNYNNKIQ